MRIFLTISPSGNIDIPGSMTWYRNLYEPLLDLGHDVYLLRIDLTAQKFGIDRKSKKFKEKFSQKLLDTFKFERTKRPFDLFLSYFIDLDIDPSCIDKIKEFCIPTANFSCNNIHQFYLTENIAPHFDYNLHSEKYVAEKFRSIGANPVWFQMAANPKWYKAFDLPRTIDVSFVGQMYARRPYYIRHLLEHGVDIQVYGPGWKLNKDRLRLWKLLQEFHRIRKCLRALLVFSPEGRARHSAWLAQLDFYEAIRYKFCNHFHLPVSDEVMVRLYSQSRISLGFLEVYEEHCPDALVFQHLHLRDFEAPMSGALYVTGYSEELTEFYEPDREVVVYRNEYELLDKVLWYLSHPDGGEKVRQAGLKRARACHTYHQRFRELFRTIGLEKEFTPKL